MKESMEGPVQRVRLTNLIHMPFDSYMSIILYRPTLRPHHALQCFNVSFSRLFVGLFPELLPMEYSLDIVHTRRNGRAPFSNSKIPQNPIYLA